MDRTRRWLGGVLIFLSACGDETQDQGFSTGDAEAFVHTLSGRVLSDDVVKTAALLRTPFKLKTRAWTTPADVAKNLPGVLPEWKEEFAGATEMEVFSHHDLLEGNWPRGRSVPAEEREAEATRLGVGSGGFLVRIAQSGRSGLQLVLAPEGTRRLLLVAVH